MRHSFATHFIEGGGDVSSLQRLLGHANISTTQIYIDQSIAHLKKAFDAANPRERTSSKTRCGTRSSAPPSSTWA